MVAAPLDAELVEQLWRDPDALVASGAMMKDGDRCTLVRLDVADHSFVLKRYNRRGLLHTILHWPLRSRARWCWLNGRRVAESGLRSPRNCAMVETRFGPMRGRSFLLSEWVEGKTLLDRARDSATTPERLAKLADAFAVVWNALGRARLGHRDMKATNFIVDDADQIWLIDLDGMRRYPSLWLIARRRKKDFARFMKNWRDVPAAARAFRARIDTNEPHGGG